MYVEMVGCYTRTPAAGRGSLSPAGAEEEERHAEAAEENSSTLKTLVQKKKQKIRYLWKYTEFDFFGILSNIKSYKMERKNRNPSLITNKGGQQQVKPEEKLRGNRRIKYGGKCQRGPVKKISVKWISKKNEEVETNYWW